MSKLPVEILDLEKLVKEQVPDWDSYQDNKKFRIKCPYCEEGKSPALSVLRNLKVGICFRCEKLFVTDTTNSALDIGLDFLFREFDNNGISEINPSILDIYEPVVGINNEYLHDRNPYVEDWSVYKVRQGKNFIFTPYFMFGKLIYYQKRFIEPREFKNPSIEAPLYLPDDSDWDFNFPLILVEGPFDAIAVDYAKKKLNLKINIAGLGGKFLSDYRKDLLSSLGRSKTVIFLDESNLSYKLAKEITGKKDIIPSYGKDPEDWLIELGLKKFYERKLKPYIEYDLFQVYKRKQKEDVIDFDFKLNL